MKKNIVNDKVIRAMAIGISAMLATTTPMTALAAEEGEGAAPEPSTGEEPKSESKVSEAKEAADSASESVDKAQTSADTVKSDVENNVVAGEAGTVTVNNDTEAGETETDTVNNDAEAGEAETDTVNDDAESGEAETKDLAQAVIDAAANVENSTSEDGSSLDEVQTDITNADDQLDVAQAKDELSGTEYSNAENAAADAADIASDVKGTMDAANEKADEQVQKIENATTVADANAAYDELAATADQAQQDFEDKLDDYNNAKALYDEAAALVAKYEKEYNDAIVNADSNAAAAQAELEKAKANAAALEQAVSAAKKAVDDSAATAMKIAEKEDLTRTDSGLNWRNEDQLFIAIMENYYLPEKLGIEGAKVTRVQGKDNNEYNYFKAVYKDADGNEQVKYYNFKMDDNGKSKDDIVIFEKREVEIFGDPNETPDQYVKDDDQKTVVDVAAGLENGTVVDADGKYYEYGSKEDKTLVSNSVITGTSKEDVTVDETSKQENWSYDAETGELVKTVTADVTTITYTEATFTSDQSYATDAERDEAAAAKEKELEDATGKDATINETEETTNTYTANGTYIPTFTKTVNVNKEYESGYLWYEADSKKEAKEKAFDWAKDKIDDDLGDYYRIGDIKSDLSVSMTEEETETYKIFGKKHTIVTDDSDYLVTGTVTATYAKVTKQTVSQSTFGALWDDIKSLFGGQSTNEKLEEAARKVVEADGGIFLSANWDDWSFNKATIRYVAGVKVTTDEQQTEKDAKNAVKKTALEQAKANGASGVYNVKTTGTDAVGHTTYSYSVDYLKEDKKTTENKTVATETYGNASGLSGQIIQNKNYYDAINKGESDKILLTQKDTDYRAFVDDAKALTGKYDRLLTEAQNANADVATAQAKVDALKAEIEALKGKSTNTKKLEELAAKLVIAQADRDAAEETLNEILEKLEKAGVTRDEVVDRLTPDTPDGGTDGNPGGTGGNGGNPGGGTPGTTYGDLGTDTTTDGLATVVTTTTTAAATANTAVAAQAVAANGAGAANVAAGNAGAGNAAGNAAAGNQGVVTIEDEASPLAASIDDQDTTDTEQNKEDAQTVTIEDEASPLDASIDQEKMSWWWLLIVLVLGATGYEMYRKHQEKKKAAEEIKVEE